MTVVNLSDPLRFARRAHGDKPPSDMIGRAMRLKRAGWDARGDSANALQEIAHGLIDMANRDLPAGAA